MFVASPAATTYVLLREAAERVGASSPAKKEATEAKARVKAEAKLTGAAGAEGKPEANVWLLEPINTDHKPAVLEGGVETRSEVDPLAVAIRAVEMLSRDDRAEFDRWYRNTCQVASAGEVTDGDTWLRDNPDQLTRALEHAPERDGTEVGEDNTVPGDDREEASATPARVPEPDTAEVKDDPIIATWLDLKPNPQKGGREWVLIGAPAVVPWDEHPRVAERLKPWREAYSIASPERQYAMAVARRPATMNGGYLPAATLRLPGIYQ
jgi:hypothetical protein